MRAISEPRRTRRHTFWVSTPPPTPPLAPSSNRAPSSRSDPTASLRFTPRRCLAPSDTMPSVSVGWRWPGAARSSSCTSSLGSGSPSLMRRLFRQYRIHVRYVARKLRRLMPPARIPRVLRSEHRHDSTALRRTTHQYRAAAPYASPGHRVASA
eukprot:2008380-Rhodomonas_salina.2